MKTLKQVAEDIDTAKMRGINEGDLDLIVKMLFPTDDFLPTSRDLKASIRDFLITYSGNPEGRFNLNYTLIHQYANYKRLGSDIPVGDANSLQVQAFVDEARRQFNRFVATLLKLYMYYLRENTMDAALSAPAKDVKASKLEFSIEKFDLFLSRMFGVDQSEA